MGVSELLGGGPGGLRAELADPHPASMRAQHAYIADHPWRPEGPYAGPVFVGLYWGIAGSHKAPGKSLVAFGERCIWLGRRIDWVGDRALRVIALWGFVAFLVTLAFIAFLTIH